MDGLTEGRIVHYVMPNGKHRPAVVVEVWDGKGAVNLQVFTDSMNDGAPNVQWQTSVPFSESPEAGTWHWIERA